MGDRNIERIVLTLAEKFPEVEFDLDFDERINFFIIFVNNFEFYLKNKRFKRIQSLLRIKYKGVKFISAYKKFSHE